MAKNFKKNDVVYDTERNTLLYVHSINDPVIRDIMGKNDYCSLIFKQISIHKKEDNIFLALDIHFKDIGDRFIKIGKL